jgi:8-oxo-dGTP diphosphatase
MESVCEYSVTHKGSQSFGWLCRCAIERFGDRPSSEIAEVRLFDRLPSALTYPDVHPKLAERADQGRAELAAALRRALS